MPGDGTASRRTDTPGRRTNTPIFECFHPLGRSRHAVRRPSVPLGSATWAVRRLATRVVGRSTTRGQIDHPGRLDGHCPERVRRRCHSRKAYRVDGYRVDNEIASPTATTRRTRSLAAGFSRSRSRSCRVARGSGYWLGSTRGPGGFPPAPVFRYEHARNAGRGPVGFASIGVETIGVENPNPVCVENPVRSASRTPIRSIPTCRGHDPVGLERSDRTRSLWSSSPGTRRGLIRRGFPEYTNRVLGEGNAVDSGPCRHVTPVTDGTSVPGIGGVLSPDLSGHSPVNRSGV